MSTWYTITVVEHDEHPRNGEAAAKPVEIVACTVQPGLAGSILRTVAEQVDPQKPTTRVRAEY